MFKIDSKLVAELASSRRLSTTFERAYYRARDVNPAAIATALEECRLGRKNAPSLFFTGMFNLAAIGMLFLFWRSLPANNDFLQLGVLWWLAAVAFCAIGGATAFIGALQNIVHHEPPGSPELAVLADFLADLNEVYAWLMPNEARRGRSDVIQFLTADRATLTKIGADIVREGAEAVMRHQRNISPLNSRSITLDGQLRYATERRYEASKRLGMVPEGGLGRYYTQAEESLAKEWAMSQDVARSEPAEPVTGLVRALKPPGPPGGPVREVEPYIHDPSGRN